ncbi:unnamed protein product, partial [Ixodes pacificus]
MREVAFSCQHTRPPTFRLLSEGVSLRRASESVASRWAPKTPLTGPEGRPRTISLPLRPPRQMVMQECDDGGIKLDSSSYRSVCQDLNGVKTMLLKLKRVLQDVRDLLFLARGWFARRHRLSGGFGNPF